MCWCVIRYSSTHEKRPTRPPSPTPIGSTIEPHVPTPRAAGGQEKLLAQEDSRRRLLHPRAQRLCLARAGARVSALEERPPLLLHNLHIDGHWEGSPCSQRGRPRGGQPLLEHSQGGVVLAPLAPMAGRRYRSESRVKALSRSPGVECGSSRTRPQSGPGASSPDLWAAE